MKKKPSIPLHYEVLDLPRFASADEVKSAYRQLVRQYHPDVNPGNPEAEDRFKAINAAYDVLKDTDKKKAYDLSLKVLDRSIRESAAQRKSKGGSVKEASAPTSSGTQKEVDSGPDSLSWDSLLNGILRRKSDESKTKPASAPGPKKESSTSEASANQSQPTGKRGADITTQTVLTAQEANRGCIQSLVIEHREPCTVCHSTGKVNGRVCGACHGQKEKRQKKRLEVRIPAGVKTGAKVRVAGEGRRGTEGGPSGDLYIEVTVAESTTWDPSLTVDETHVRLEWPVPLPMAVLGGEVEVPTRDGKQRLSIPAGTQHGQVLRMKGLGVQKNGMGSVGDQLVTVQLEVPTQLSARQIDLYNALKAIEEALPPE